MSKDYVLYYIINLNETEIADILGRFHDRESAVCVMRNNIKMLKTMLSLICKFNIRITSYFHDSTYPRTMCIDLNELNFNGSIILGIDKFPLVPKKYKKSEDKN